MLHQNLDELRLKAEVTPLEAKRKVLTRAERLEHWANLLDAHRGPLVPFFRIEAYAWPERMTLRGDESPVAVAFHDPVLRADGLAGDTLGDACTYFELSDGQAHRLLCDCHYRGTMTGTKVAARLRGFAQGGVFQRLWAWATN